MPNKFSPRTTFSSRPFSPLKLYRLNRGLRQEDLAQLVGIKQSQITVFESGRRRPSTKIAAAIAGALGLTTREVFPGLEDAAAVPEKDPDESQRS